MNEPTKALLLEWIDELRGDVEGERLLEALTLSRHVASLVRACVVTTLADAPLRHPSATQIQRGAG